MLKIPIDLTTLSNTAIITGVSGQDGSYLASFLLKKGYTVIGIVRSLGSTDLKGLRYLGIYDQILIEECDLLDVTQIIRLIKDYKPREIYNLAAQSSVGQSFFQPIGTIQYNINSVLNLLEAIKNTGLPVRFYQASSSEMYGKVKHLPINEDTPFHPLSPYAVSKASAHWIATNYREAYDLYVACGILFNHESYLRKHTFFVKKVISDSIDIKIGKRQYLEVGNIEIKRDFGFAPKYVEAMWLMLQQDTASDYLICSNKSISLRDIIEYVFKYLEINTNCLRIEQSLFRPTDIEDIYGDNTLVKEKLGWQYEMDFKTVLSILIDEEMTARKIITPVKGSNL